MKPQVLPEVSWEYMVAAFSSTCCNNLGELNVVKMKIMVVKVV